jgi:hypothetical protein
MRRSAAELRWLHAECNDLAHQLNESNERNGRLKAQRDALLEALKLARSIIGHPDDAHSQMINAVIKAVEETK